ncbi:MAG: chromate transporter [Armatimonas sp.]
MPPHPAAGSPPSSKVLFGEWFALGLQSFGGGSSLTLIHRTIVERREWIPDGDFTRNWALCQVCPGINLVAFTLLCGKQIAGVRGMVLCLFAFLLPCVTITILLSAAYAQVRNSVIVTKALNAILPASVGLGLLAAYNMVKEPLRQSREEGAGQLFLAWR